LLVHKENLDMKLVKIAVATLFSSIAVTNVASAMPSYITATNTWSQDNPNIPPLISSANNFCYLTHVVGHFVGGGEWVHVYIDSDNNWRIGGGSQQQNVAASANCLAYSNFIPEAGLFGGPAPGAVNNWTGEVSVNSGPCPNCSSSGAFGVGASVDIWQGDAAAMLSGMTGQFNGGGEIVQVDEATSPSTFNVLNVQALSPNGVGAWARALFVGVPQSGYKPKFYGSTGGPGPIGAPYSVTASSSRGIATTTVPMIPTNLGICYFTKIGGIFAGWGESATIGTVLINGKEYWNLTVTSGQPNGTFAEAQCYAFNQAEH
jgi:hypothetical protein